MKKKIYRFVSVAVITVAMAVSVQMSNAKHVTNETLAIAAESKPTICFFNPIIGECDTGGVNVCYGVHDCNGNSLQ